MNELIVVSDHIEAVRKLIVQNRHVALPFM